MVMKRGQNVKMFLSQPPAPENDEERFWSNLCNRIGNGQVIPILSNGMVYDLVFSKALGDEQPADAAPLPNGAPAPETRAGRGRIRKMKSRCSS
jgi:hypothetical protein